MSQKEPTSKVYLSDGHDSIREMYPNEEPRREDRARTQELHAKADYIAVSGRYGDKYVYDCWHSKKLEFEVDATRWKHPHFSTKHYRNLAREIEKKSHLKNLTIIVH